MEEGSSAVLSAAAGSVDVSIHPLVIMNISDHCTRARVEQKTPLRGEYVAEAHLNFTPYS